MSDIAIVTHTLHRSPWAGEAMQSVLRNMPDNAIHVVEDGSRGLETVRPMALRKAPFVCFVDDDDIVVNDSIRLTYAALEAYPEAGVAFTSEVMIDEAGHVLRHNNNPVTYQDVANMPTAIHGLAMIRTRCVNPEAAAFARAYGAGIDWLTVASAALEHGAIHVPIIGYHWRRHEQSHSMRCRTQFARALPMLRAATHRWMGQRHGPVEQFLPRHGASVDASRAA